MRPELLVVYELPPFYDKVTFIYKKNYFLLICINSGKKIDESKFPIFSYSKKKKKNCYIFVTQKTDYRSSLQNQMKSFQKGVYLLYEALHSNFFLFPCSSERFFWIVNIVFVMHCRPSAIPGPVPDELVLPATESIGLFQLM